MVDLKPKTAISEEKTLMMSGSRRKACPVWDSSVLHSSVFHVPLVLLRVRASEEDAGLRVVARTEPLRPPRENGRAVTGVMAVEIAYGYV